MANKRKKALFVIVEGESDSLFFFEELQRICRDEHIHIKAYHGDIFTDLNQQNIPIRDRVRTFFKDRLDNLRISDFLGIIHFTDTDGAYANDEYVIVDQQQQDKIRYHNRGIYVNSDDQQLKMQLRNKLKLEHTSNARKLMNITYKSTEIPYRLFYLSQNLEHLVFDALNVPDNEKVKKIVGAMSKQSGQVNVESLLKQHHPALSNITDKYRDSWDFIFQGDNSLQRYTNAALMYDYLEELLAAKK
ncbi:MULTISPECIES: hypothetical protein [Paenibacillus]|uniref:DUF4276 family protein n=1 Tax=Paenibacillus amylolyticus TaxID=1451 RepID=A0ABD8B253_PAEAM|nr:hypothetical protein [Paenibacillus sp. GM1FR]PJN64548.1 hypothetical protein PAEAM_06340 [Paenibacillus sp. GM1FR]